MPLPEESAGTGAPGPTMTLLSTSKPSTSTFALQPVKVNPDAVLPLRVLASGTSATDVGMPSSVTSMTLF